MHGDLNPLLIAERDGCAAARERGRAGQEHACPSSRRGEG
jgi:hypothetical protein